MSGRLGLEGRCALVTGGGANGGRASVQGLREEGMTVVFTDVSRERGDSIAQHTGAMFLECGPLDRAATDGAVERALELCSGRLDVLVTTADTVYEESVQRTSDPMFRELIEANLTALFRTARACFEQMRVQGGGSMIHVVSAAGIRAAHEAAAFSVASAGALAVAELLAAEGGPHGIRSNAVCPGWGDEAAHDEPAGRTLASLVAWLACDDSAHMSGATLRLDGGASAAMILDTRA